MIKSKLLRRLRHTPSYAASYSATDWRDDAPLPALWRAHHGPSALLPSLWRAACATHQSWLSDAANRVHGRDVS